MSLERSYTLLAPFYDLIAGPAFRGARKASLEILHETRGREVLLNGIGTGLDLPYLPQAHRYTALDLTGAMLKRALPRASELDVAWMRGDSQALPFRDDAFDYVVLHLIIAVVPRPDRVLAEAARVAKAGGTLLVFDKFLELDTRAPFRRMLNSITSRIATRMDVVFETLLASAPRLRVIADEPQLAGGWFRRIRLEKR